MLRVSQRFSSDLASPPPQLEGWLTVSDTRSIHRSQGFGLAAAILAMEYIPGPFIQFPILFVLPLALATATDGRALDWLERAYEERPAACSG